MPVVNVPCDHHAGAQPVDDGGADGADQAEGHEEHAAVHGALRRRCRAPGRPGRRTRRSPGRSCPNSFTSRAPDTLNRSVMVAFIAALSCMPSRVMRLQPPADPLGRDEEGGNDDQRQQREPPLEDDHHDQGEREVDDVGHDRRACR